MYEWKIKFCKYGRAWYTPYLMIDYDKGGIGIAFIALRWQIAIMRVHTKAYWEAAFDEYEATKNDPIP